MRTKSLKQGHWSGMRQAAVVICLGLLFSGLWSCSSKQPKTAETREPGFPIQWLEVSVAYRDGSFLPSGSVLTLTLEDISKADAPAEFVGETILDVEGEPPYVASLGYNPKLVQAGGRYSLRAEIRHYDRLLYRNATLVNPFEKEAATQVEVPLTRVPRSKEKQTP